MTGVTVSVNASYRYHITDWLASTTGLAAVALCVYRVLVIDFDNIPTSEALDKEEAMSFDFYGVQQKSRLPKPL